MVWIQFMLLLGARWICNYNTSKFDVVVDTSISLFNIIAIFSQYNILGCITSFVDFSIQLPFITQTVCTNYMVLYTESLFYDNVIVKTGRIVMNIHHVVLIYLMFLALSYNMQLVSIGVFLAQLSTPFLSLSKYYRYSNKGLAKIFFKIYIVAFFIFRIVLHPICCIIPAYLFSKQHLPTEIYIIINIILSSLWFLQIYWFVQIVKIARKVLKA